MKAAAGLPVTSAMFHPTTLTVGWRPATLAAPWPDRRVREVVPRDRGAAGTTRRVSDSTIMDEMVPRQDGVTQLIAAVRRMGRELPGCGRLDDIADTGTPARPGKAESAWDCRQARKELGSGPVNNEWALVERMAKPIAEQCQGRMGPDRRAGGTLPVLMARHDP